LDNGDFPSAGLDTATPLGDTFRRNGSKAANIPSGVIGEVGYPDGGDRLAIILENKDMFQPNIELMFALEKSAGHWKATLRLSLS
jgi:hypothetical protein